MSKKREPEEAEVQPAAETPAPEEADVSAKPEHYDVGTWNGLPHYACRYCPFDSLDEEDIRTHYIERHGPPPPPTAPPVPKLYDRFNNPLN